jgi:hypothetical protein
MTILPKKKHPTNKNDDGAHQDPEQPHHGHGHRDRVDHVVGHVQV